MIQAFIVFFLHIKTNGTHAAVAMYGQIFDRPFWICVPPKLSWETLSSENGGILFSP